ncbi:MAG: hypothetical protein HONDAALG_02308 [Gammaproteobacteria bacterium]|nr:hypothetical protein [Gammaproteobacteria bacterium]
MTKGTVASRRGDWAAVVEAVNAVFGGKEFILLAEDADALISPHFEPKNTLETDAQLPRGRAFDKEREVRWRERSGGLFIVTYLSESGVPPDEARFVDEGSEWETRKTWQKLYGKWNGKLGDWVEVSVPGIKDKYKAVYTGEPNSPLQIDAVDYSRDGIVQMTRFCGISDYKKPKGE